MSKNLSELGALELKNLAEQGCFVGKEVKRRVKEIDNMPRTLPKRLWRDLKINDLEQGARGVQKGQ